VGGNAAGTEPSRGAQGIQEPEADAPACPSQTDSQGVTFAYNPDSFWLKEHLTGLDGKFADVTTTDLLLFAERHRVPYAKKTLKQVQAAVAEWPAFAQQAGVSPGAQKTIATALALRP